MKSAACFLSFFLLPLLCFADEPEPVRVVRAQLQAFNYHDAEKVAAFVAEEVVWYNITADAVSREGKGRRPFQATMAMYFESVPTAHAEIDGVSCAGEYVTFRETTTWSSPDDGAHSESCVAVYQVHDGLITRTWYYPATFNPIKPQAR